MFTQKKIVHIRNVVRHYLMPSLPDRNHSALLMEFGLENAFNEVILHDPDEAAFDASKDNSFRVSSWNIQFGKCIDDIIKSLLDNKELRNSDVITIQELTRNNPRSSKRDLLEEIHKATGLGYAYAVNYLELDKGSYEGEIGNMILSRHPIKEPGILHLSQGIDIFRSSKKNMIGGRIAVSGTISKNGKKFRVYCVHLEAYTSPKCRAKQFAEIIKDAESYKDKPVIIAGDFNFGPFEQFNNHGPFHFDDPIGKGAQSTLNDFLGKLMGLKTDRILSTLRLSQSKILDLPYSDHFPITALYQT